MDFEGIPPDSSCLLSKTLSYLPQILKLNFVWLWKLMENDTVAEGGIQIGFTFQ